MGTPSVSFNRLAIRDYREARDYYAARSSVAASKFVEAVDAAVRRIIQAPDSLPSVSGRFRRVRVEKYPHSIILYTRAELDIRIVAVAHASRRPGYWRKRK